MQRYVLDPSLVAFDANHLRYGLPHCQVRIGAFAHHTAPASRSRRRLAVTASFVDGVLNEFPHSVAGGVPELRDFHSVFNDAVENADYVDEHPGTHEEDPPALLCCHLPGTALVAEWSGLLRGIAAADQAWDVVVATWPRDPPLPEVVQIRIHPPSRGPIGPHALVLAWTDEQWLAGVSCLVEWPDLDGCVDTYLQVTPAVRAMVTGRLRLGLGATPRFMRAAAKTGVAMREALIGQLAKLVHGVRDAGMEDEAVNGTRRFRLSARNRVHYRQDGGRIVLTAIGGHRLEGVGGRRSR